MKRNLIAGAMIMLLAGCGGSSSGGNGDGDGGTNPPPTDGIFDVPTPEVWAKMKGIKVNRSDIPNNEQCNVEGSLVLETEDLYVGFYKAPSIYSSSEMMHEDDLRFMAQMAQVALNEVAANAELDKEIDLGITEGNKWFTCFGITKIGRGSGHVGGMDISPRAFDEGGLKLAKHELFHTIQSRLLGDVPAYHHLPYWFQEATAEYYAQDRNVSNIQLKTLQDFIDDLNEHISGVHADASTPLGILLSSYAKELEDEIGYESNMYSIYSTMLNYLMENGLDHEDILDLTRESADDHIGDDERTKFHEYMDILVSSDDSVNLEVNYTTLKDNQLDFERLVIDDWLTGQAPDEDGFCVGNFTYPADADGVTLRTLYFSKSFGEEPIGSGVISGGQYKYDPQAIGFGVFELFAAPASEDVIYVFEDGRKFTVTDECLGHLDFSEAVEIPMDD